MQTHGGRLARFLVPILWIGITAGSAAAADGPLTLVVPYPPGGFVDTVARALAQPLSAALQQPVVIQNRAGANGDIGHAAVAHSPPDGRTLLLAAPSLAAQPAIDALSGRRPAFALESLLPLAQLTSDPAILLVHPSLQVKTLAEYLAKARARPLGLSVSSSGTYGATHLPVAMLEMQSGIRLLHAPTAGGAQAIAMAMGGHTTAVMAALSVARIPIDAGRLIPVAQSGSRRLRALPDVPTFVESGVNVEFALWTSVFARAETPPAELKRLQEGLRKAAQDEGYKSTLVAAQSTPAYLEVEGEPFRGFWLAEVAKLQATVRHIGKVEEPK